MMRRKAEYISNSELVQNPCHDGVRAVRGGGNYLSLTTIFRYIGSTISTTLLWSNIAMNKQYMTNFFVDSGYRYSPFSNRNLAAMGLCK